MKYPWIFFDADETLFHFDAFKGLQLMFLGYGVTFTRNDYQQYQSVNLPLWVQYQDGQIDAETLKHKRFENWAEKLQVTTQDLNSQFLRAMAEICTLLPGAAELLAILSGKATLGIITNGFTDLQHVRLQKMGLDETFSVIIISEEVGVAKPHIDIFNQAFKAINHPPKDHILMVGDNLFSDITGGINAGIHTCWLNRNDEACPDHIQPHYQVNSLSELSAILTA